MPESVKSYFIKGFQVTVTKTQTAGMKPFKIVVETTYGGPFSKRVRAFKNERMRDWHWNRYTESDAKAFLTDAMELDEEKGIT